MYSWCPGLSDNVSVRLSIHQSELSVLQSLPSVFLGETPLLKLSSGDEVIEETELVMK